MVYIWMMNYLAHLYLSCHDQNLMVGNFIGDHITNREMKHLPAAICEGVEMHRAIDYYTDTHPVTRQVRASLFETYRHRSRVIVDLFYDHFLAADFESISGESLSSFSNKVQDDLNQHITHMPLSAKKYLRAMENHDWLNQYATLDGLAGILQIMSRRKNVPNMGASVEVLKMNYPYYKNSFYLFFQDLQAQFKQKQ